MLRRNWALQTKPTSYTVYFYCSVYTYLYIDAITLYLQEIKRDNDGKGTTSCKITLYRTFLRCGIKTWEQVIEALNNSGYDKIAEQVQERLLKDFATG